MRAAVTIQQVAAEAGVSVTTVSNLLMGRQNRMLPTTRERVEAAITRLGYRPNPAARTLRTGHASSVGLVVPSVANPFWGAFASELERAAIAAGYTVLLGNADRDPAMELRYVQELWDAGVRSIVLGTSLPSLSHLEPIIERGLHLVTFDRPIQPNDPASVVSISVDNHLGGFMAAAHLTALGHRKLTFIAGSLHSLNRTARYGGFCAALKAAGINPEEVPVWQSRAVAPTNFMEAAEVGRSAIRDILSTDDPPTAVVAVNDMTALGVFGGIRELGLRVGEDVSVVGFDDIVLALVSDPPLTTIRQPLAELAQLAIREALTERSDAATPGQSILLRPELVVRDSTRPPPPDSPVGKPPGL